MFWAKSSGTWSAVERIGEGKEGAVRKLLFCPRRSSRLSRGVRAGCREWIERPFQNHDSVRQFTLRVSLMRKFCETGELNLPTIWHSTEIRLLRLFHPRILRPRCSRVDPSRDQLDFLFVQCSKLFPFRKRGHFQILDLASDNSSQETLRSLAGPDGRFAAFPTFEQRIPSGKFESALGLVKMMPSIAKQPTCFQC